MRRVVSSSVPAKTAATFAETCKAFFESGRWDKHKITTKPGLRTGRGYTRCVPHLPILLRRISLVEGPRDAYWPHWRNRPRSNGLLLSQVDLHLCEAKFCAGTDDCAR